MRKKLVVALMVVTLFFIGTSHVYATDGLLKTQFKDKVIFVQGEGGKFNYSWSFNKRDVKNKSFDFDMGISFKTKGLFDLDEAVGNRDKKKLISFNHHGDLPGTAIIKVPVDDCFKDGDVLSLYYYNEDNDKAELIEKRLRVINGHVTFEISHCSDYFVTLSIVNETHENGSNGIVIIGMIIVIVGLVGYTIFKNKK